MKIINETDIRTRDLRRLLFEVSRREGYNDQEYLRYLTVKVTPGRKGRWGVYRHHGKASIAAIVRPGEFSSAVRRYGQWLYLTVPPPEHLDPAEFASVIRHEMAHNYGARHASMSTSLRYCHPLEWAFGFVLQRQPVKVKVRPTVDTKLVHALKMRRAAETKAKRATTILKRWTRKVRYYESKQESKLKLAAGESHEG